MIPVNPEAIGLFGLFATVICFGLEQLGVGVKGADHEKLTRTLGYIAIFFGGFTQLFTSLCMYLFSVGGDHSVYLGTVFGFFGLFWILVGFFFIKGGDKKAMAHFFLCGLILCIGFTIRAFQDGLVWPLGIDLVVIDVLLLTLIPAWYTGKPALTKLAGLCNVLPGQGNPPPGSAGDGSAYCRPAAVSSTRRSARWCSMGFHCTFLLNSATMEMGM